MADKLRFYKICPSCGGTGVIHGIETSVCRRCKNEAPPFGAKVFDGLRHVYVGRFEEVEDK